MLSGIYGVCCYAGWKLYKGCKHVYNVYSIIKKSNPTKSDLVNTLKTGQFFSNIVLLRIEQYFRRTYMKYKNYYIIQVTIDGKLYKFIIKPERGPSDLDPLERGYQSLVCQNQL